MYSWLKPSLIFCFNRLAKEFKLNFLASARPRPTATSLLRMSQKEDEPLAEYVAQFMIKIRGMPNAHPSLMIQTFLIRLQSSRFFWSLVEHPPTTVPKMLQRANQYIATEALVAGKREDQKRPHVDSSRGPPPGPSRRRMERTEPTIPRLPNTPLNSIRTEIFLQI
ncbi:hypothetical protein BHE74_00046234 [Ensete ventricosum]|nr:hypothetical protein GW17_00056126 [Ensete ventricosum]RWW47742.1 hypothetical protein BHE74_00046234 [Ensete ventricosum]